MTFLSDRELNELLADALDSLSWEMVYKAQQALRDRLAQTVHASDISQECVHILDKHKHEEKNS
jgi:hypothetical protein